MTFELAYGDGDRVQVDLPPELVLDFSLPRGESLTDPIAAVEAALADPLGFPPLVQATVPGDRIAIALDRGVPMGPAAVAGVVRTLLQGHTRPGDIRVIVADERDLVSRPTGLLPAEIRDAISVTVHDPHRTDGLAYLAASRDGKPIYFNRAIDEADVVLPIGQLRLDSAWGYVGVHGCLYPRFSDAATQQRFRKSESDWTRLQRVRREEAEEAAWLLGVQFTIQLTPGPGNTLLNVLAGDAHVVAEQGRRMCEGAWLHRPARRANLVVAAIDGGPSEQTWENFSRALRVASQAVSDGGAIVLCTRIQVADDDAESPAPEVEECDSVGIESLSARRVATKLLDQTRERAQVFLLSDLNGDLVEDLGLGHVSNPEEVTRLSRRFSSCILLGKAQHAQVATSDD
jgi:nickel-dependent lactate racemase